MDMPIDCKICRGVLPPTKSVLFCSNFTGCCVQLSYVRGPGSFAHLYKLSFDCSQCKPFVPWLRFLLSLEYVLLTNQNNSKIDEHAKAVLLTRRSGILTFAVKPHFTTIVNPEKCSGCTYNVTANVVEISVRTA